MKTVGDAINFAKSLFEFIVKLFNFFFNKEEEAPAEEAEA